MQISPVQRGRRESYEECLKFVQDVHKGGGGGLLISSMGGIDIFLHNPFCGNIRKNYCQGINYHVFLLINYILIVAIKI